MEDCENAAIRLTASGKGSQCPPVPLVPSEPSMVHSSLPPTLQLDVGGCIGRRRCCTVVTGSTVSGYHDGL